MINKTFRMPKPLMDDLDSIARQESISVNNLVVQCCEYALGSMGGDAGEVKDGLMSGERG